MKRFEGRTALVTGAASGIGRALAARLGRAGAHLVLVDIQRAPLEALASALAGPGTRVHVEVVDLADPAAIAALSDRSWEATGGIDLLVNNAGVAAGGPFTAVPLSDWDWLLAVNLLAPVHLTHALLPRMLERGGGQVVVVASVAGFVALPGLSAYSASKYALVGAFESIRNEVAPHGVPVTVVYPGYVRTGILQRARIRVAGDRIRDALSGGGITPERAAEVIFRGIRQERERVLVTPEAHLLWGLKRLSPRLVSRLMRAGIEALGRHVAAAAEE